MQSLFHLALGSDSALCFCFRPPLLRRNPTSSLAGELSLLARRHRFRVWAPDHI
jgi:hypothetical protein